MANENKNIKELVSDDDDPTSELEVLSFRDRVTNDDTPDDSESNAHTCALGGTDDDDIVVGQSIPELQSDLKSRAKKIGRLQYDIQQLRSKWLGLEAEIGAREEIANNLLRDNKELNNKIGRNEKLLKKRSASIKALKVEIRQRDGDRLKLEQELAEQLRADADHMKHREQAERELQQVRNSLERAQADYAAVQADLQQRNDGVTELERRLADQLQADAAHVKSREQADRELQQTRDTLERAEADLQQRNDDVAELERKLAEQLQADAAHVKSREQADRELQQTHESLERAQADLQQRNDDVAELERKLAEQLQADAAHVRSREQADRELQQTRESLEQVQADYADVEANLQQRDDDVAELERRLEEQQQAAEKQATELEEAQLEIGKLSAELESAENDERNLNVEINRRDQLQSNLELKISSLEEQSAEHRLLEADYVARLEAAMQEISGLQQELESAQQQGAAQMAQTQKTTSSVVGELRARLQKTEQYADTLRFKLHDVSESLSHVLKNNDNLEIEVGRLTNDNTELHGQVESLHATNEEVTAALERLNGDHEQELRTLRFELTEAQDSIVQTGDLNNQLASDLVSTRVFKEELERMLLRNEEESQQRVAELEQQLKELTAASEEFEQKLDTKNTAINVLLGELSKKSEQIESIGEIEEVIHEIDNRISERIELPGADPGNVVTSTDRDRVTRVLVGSIGEQELRFPLFKKRLTIGRTADNDIQLKTSYISRRHAVVMTEGDSTRVIDWGSKNGVYVNTERVKERFLSNGDIVAIGNAKFRYEERPKRDA